MKSIFALTILVLLSFMACNNDSGEDETKKAIRATFENYKAAIVKDNGTTAVNFVDTRTLDYYTELLDVVLYADSIKVDQLTILDKFQVLAIRYIATDDQLLSLNGKGFLAFTIDEGMTSKNVIGVKVDHVIVDGNFARGEISAEGKKAELYFSFYKEAAGWKLDLTSIFDVSTLIFNKMIADSQLSENEFILMILRNLTKKRSIDEIWDPISE